MVKFKKDLYDENIKSQFVSLKENRFGYEGLMDDKLKAREIFGNEAVYEKCSLDDILIYYVG